MDGNNLRRIARNLKVAPRKVAYWVTDLTEALPNVRLPNEVKEAEMDEMFTFIGDKKRNLHSHSSRPQNSLHFGLGSNLGSHAALQQVVDQAPKAK